MPEGGNARYLSSTENISMPGRENALCSLMSIIIANIGDIADENTHPTFDKKSLIRLFTHFRYSHILTPENLRDYAMPPDFRIQGLDQIAYYIYTLQKIVI